ncbi:MAG: hypothetical protein ACYC0V_18345 [Armatimonadota bacterium]
MKKDVGLWIDHRKAVIVTLDGENTEIQEVSSIMERQDLYDNDPRNETADDIIDRHYNGHLKEYYDNVITTIRDAASLFIMGPGEAKGELRKRLEKEGLGSCVVGVEKADKLSDKQIAVRVHQYFSGAK